MQQPTLTAPEIVEILKTAIENNQPEKFRFWVNNPRLDQSNEFHCDLREKVYSMLTSVGKYNHQKMFEFLIAPESRYLLADSDCKQRLIESQMKDENFKRRYMLYQDAQFDTVFSLELHMISFERCMLDKMAVLVLEGAVQNSDLNMIETLCRVFNSVKLKLILEPDHQFDRIVILALERATENGDLNMIKTLCSLFKINSDEASKLFVEAAGWGHQEVIAFLYPLLGVDNVTLTVRKAFVKAVTAVGESHHPVLTFLASLPCGTEKLTELREVLQILGAIWLPRLNPHLLDQLQQMSRSNQLQHLLQLVGKAITDKNTPGLSPIIPGIIHHFISNKEELSPEFESSDDIIDVDVLLRVLMGATNYGQISQKSFIESQHFQSSAERESIFSKVPPEITFKIAKLGIFAAVQEAGIECPMLDSDKSNNPSNLNPLNKGPAGS